MWGLLWAMTGCRWQGTAGRRLSIQQTAKEQAGKVVESYKLIYKETTNYETQAAQSLTNVYNNGMNKKQFATISVVILLALSVIPVLAATGADESINPPGWLGWVLVILALILPAVVKSLMNNRG